MIKNLKAYKKNFTLATMVLMAVAMTGCAKKEETQTVQQEQTIEQDQNQGLSQDGKIYYSTYDSDQQEFIWQEVTEEEAENINEAVVAEDEVMEDGNRYIATSEAFGYVAASKNETKKAAIENNPQFQDDALFLTGFEQGKQDKYLKLAREEYRQYVAIREYQEPTSMMDETYYYPLEELQVVSYIGENAIVRDTTEEQVKAGEYEDVLGKDMTSYIGQEYMIESLRSFAGKYMHEIPDGVYLYSGDFRKIPEITKDTFINQNDLTTQKAK